VQLKVIETIPDDVLKCEAKDLHRILGGPTIMHIKGTNPKAVFISCLLHGNEVTGFYAIQRLLQSVVNSKPNRDIILFFGNTLAAQTGERHLFNQPDYNRIWEVGDLPENKLAMDVLSYAKEQSLFACLDIHNNSGKNPYYGCVNFTDKNWIQLAGLFSKRIVYFTEPSEVLSNAFSTLCPAVTIEAGLPGKEEGIITVLNYLKTIINLDSFDEKFDAFSVDVFHTIGRIMVEPTCSVDFEDKKESTSDLSFSPTIDEKNFEIVPKFTHFGYAKNLDSVKAINNKDEIITEDIFFLKEGSLQSNRIFIPAMFTKDIFIMKEDCMGYIMEKMIPLKN